MFALAITLSIWVGTNIMLAIRKCSDNLVVWYSALRCLHCSPMSQTQVRDPSQISWSLHFLLSALPSLHLLAIHPNYDLIFIEHPWKHDASLSRSIETITWYSMELSAMGNGFVLNKERFTCRSDLAMSAATGKCNFPAAVWLVWGSSGADSSDC